MSTRCAGCGKTDCLLARVKSLRKALCLACWKRAGSPWL